jgi:hypothetical protein
MRAFPLRVAQPPTPNAPIYLDAGCFRQREGASTGVLSLICCSEDVDIPLLGSGCFGRVDWRAELLPFGAFAVTHVPSKYMLTARSMLLDATD